MKIAIISDIHDHRHNLRLALQQLQEADEMICCGDLCSPFIMRDLGSGFQRPIHIVFGNNDGDLFRLTQTAAGFPHIHLYGEVAELQLGGQLIALTHFDTVARMLATSDHYDVICFGHNHQYQVKKRGRLLLINPGEVMGELTGQATAVLLDSATREVQRIDIAGAG